MVSLLEIRYSCCIGSPAEWRWEDRAEKTKTEKNMSMQTQNYRQSETLEAESAVCVQLAVTVSSRSKGRGHDWNISRSLRDGSCHIRGQGEPPPVVFLSSFIMPPEAECAHLFFLYYFQIRQPPPHIHIYLPFLITPPLPSSSSSSTSSSKSCPGNLNLGKSLSSPCVSGWVL